MSVNKSLLNPFGRIDPTGDKIRKDIETEVEYLQQQNQAKNMSPEEYIEYLMTKPDTHKGSDNPLDFSDYNFAAGRKAKYNDAREMYKAYKEIQDKYDTQYMDNKTLIERLVEIGELDAKTGAKYEKLLDTADSKYTKHGLARWWESGVHAKKANDKYMNMFQDIYSKLPKLEQSRYISDDYVNGILGALRGPGADIANVPAPNYIPYDIDIQRMPVTPMHLWSNRELADLHGIDYDLDKYYDLIKQGTEANVALGEYKSDQLRNSTMVDDTRRRTDYLDALRDEKAKAIVSGMTSGSRAANELLQLQSELQGYSDNQATVAKQRYDAVNDYLEADAKARLTALDYYNKLAQSLSTDSSTLYANDAERVTGEYNADSTMVQGAAEALGEIARANATMNSAYNTARAGINGARSGANQVGDDLATLYNIYLQSHGYDPNKPDSAQSEAITKTNNDFNKYIRGGYLTDRGYTSYTDAYNANKK